MNTIEPNTDLRRRRFLQTTAVLAGGGVLGGMAEPASAQETDLSAWFSDVSNYDGLVDERGRSEVSIMVGAAGNGGGFAFEPAAVRVDPGTAITWEWTGDGGSHDVAAEDDSFGSPLQSDPGDTFRHTPETEGTTTYACTPHRSMGMKGALVVGDAEVPGLEAAGPAFVSREPDYGNWFEATGNFEGTVDMRGREEVSIQVLVDENSGEFAFSPPAVHVDPGTRVRWEWDGDVSHRIEAVDGQYASPDQSSGEWGLQFDGVGISRYASAAHDGQGMRGAVVVGDISAGVYELSPTTLTVAGGLGAAFLSPVAFGAFLWHRGKPDRPSEE